MNRSIRIQVPGGDGEDCLDLAVVFEKHADRWSHYWTVAKGSSPSVRFLISVEGSPDTDFPPSPPIQDLDLHDLGNGNAILGVGMAGRSHWSISYSGGSGNGSLEADLACLRRPWTDDDSPFLGSTYQVPETVGCRLLGDRAELRIPELDLVLEIASPRQDLVLHQSLPDQLTLVPASRSRSQEVATRWNYAIGWLGSIGN